MVIFGKLKMKMSYKLRMYLYLSMIGEYVRTSAMP